MTFCGIPHRNRASGVEATFGAIFHRPKGTLLGPVQFQLLIGPELCRVANSSMQDMRTYNIDDNLRRVRMKILLAHVELGRTLSRKVKTDAFLFKATKGR
jgi:hypothetical protein